MEAVSILRKIIVSASSFDGALLNDGTRVYLETAWIDFTPDEMAYLDTIITAVAEAIDG